jgi:hypothetical protein
MKTYRQAQTEAPTPTGCVFGGELELPMTAINAFSA